MPDAKKFESPSCRWCGGPLVGPKEQERGYCSRRACYEDQYGESPERPDAKGDDGSCDEESADE